VFQSEEEALQRALEMSLAESARSAVQPPRYGPGTRGVTPQACVRAVPGAASYGTGMMLTSARGSGWRLCVADGGGGKKEESRAIPALCSASRRSAVLGGDRG